jgi:hypothetical protein
LAHQIVSVRVEGIPDTTLAHRWLIGPSAVGALLAAAVTRMRRRVAEPGMPRMSSEWLLSHDRFSGRRYTGGS